MKILILLLFLSCGKAPLFDAVQDDENTSSLLELESSEFFDLNSDTQFGIRWIESPTTSSKSSFQIKFWDQEDGHFLGPYLSLESELCVFLWMIMPDGSEHGSSPVYITKEGDTYLVDDLYFIMPGKWQLYIRTVKDSSQCSGTKDSSYLDQYVFNLYIK